MKRLLYLFSFCLMLGAQAFAQTAHFISSDRFSSSLIADLCQDKQGSIWIATDYGLNRFDGYAFQTFLHNDADTTSMGANTVVSLLCDREGRLWVGTNQGLDRFDANREQFVHYRFPDALKPRVSSLLQLRDGRVVVGTAGYGAFAVSADGKAMSRFSLDNADNFFSRHFEDSQGTLWKNGFDNKIWKRVGNKFESFDSPTGNPQGYAEADGELLIICNHGIMSSRNGQLRPADVDMSVVAGQDVIFTCSCVAADGSIVIGSRGKGLFRLNTAKPRRLERVDIDAFGVDTRTTKITAAMFDRQGNLWLGCHSKGLLMLPYRPVLFSNWSFEAQGIRLGSTVSSVCEGDGGIIWCTVQGVGVYGFNQRGHVVAHPKAPDAVEFIFRDKLRRYWVGTDDGLYSYDPSTGQSQLKVNFDCDKFNDMTSDASGRMFISTFSRGFCVYDPQSGSLHNYNMYSEDAKRGRLCNNWIMGMSSDRQGFIWMATSSGFSCFDPKTESFLSQGWQSQLDGIVCFDVCEIQGGSLPDGRLLDGSVAIGTERGLYLYDRKTKKTELFPGSELLQNKAISYIIQANDGDLWCSTSNGIWQYQQSTHTFIGHVNGNGLTKKEYLYGVGMHTDNDRVFFGHNDGLTAFSPKNVKEEKPLLDPLQLSAFFVGNIAVTQGTELNGVNVTDKPVGESDYFTLSYLDHTITLAFSQFNFDNPRNIIFEFRVNSDDQWMTNPAGKNELTLGHLQPGTYRVEARALVGDQYTPSKVIFISVRAPWYRSTLAYFIYFLLVAAFVYYVQSIYRRHANQQLNEEKMQFLINATHDIRSPLTLILAALKKLEKNQAVDTIEHNSQRILNLVNQILDVRKIDKQQLMLHCQETDLVDFTTSICKMFEFNATERNIQFAFHHDGLEQLNVWIDRRQFDKVVTNLLSNAFKYSYEGGSIDITLKSDAQQAVFTVADTGVGLDAESLKHIFDRFYQGGNSRRMHIDGTGIGLNLCKMIVDMHHGTIEAQNRSDGQQGSVFTVTLPLGTKHLKEEEMEKTPDNQPPLPVAPANGGASQSGSQKRRVLIVDDDLEIGHYVSTELGHYYKFGICSNGKEGLKELLTHEYDVVISDVMMPEMDGFTMLRMIKTNLNISHIPVIMLTSKADVGNRLEGLERGADAFLAKPFDMEELHLTIDNLIQGRQRLKGKFTGAQQQADKVEQREVKGNDELLMERIMKAVNKNLSNSDFNVDMLTQEVGISRAQLHRKMKEMTGISTSEFIRNIRLEQAARLLKEQKINVTQVAYAVGFSNLAHFSTIFRKHFGVAPSEYASK